MHENYKKANRAPRCKHRLADGRGCPQPALRNHRFCRLHDPSRNKTAGLAIALPDSPENIQAAITQVVSAMLEGRMDGKTGAACLYGLQLATANLKRLHEEPTQAELDFTEILRVAEHEITRSPARQISRCQDLQISDPRDHSHPQL